jgi:flagellar hook protein FlgE
MVVNPGGLEKVGGNLYRLTPNADTEELVVGLAGDAEAGSGTIISGQLEMSNVDLTGEFTEMIVAQRGFQSNSRIITTSDEILQEIVNLKR